MEWGLPDNHEDRIRFLTLALCGEAGELANIVKKDWRGDSGDREEALKEEMADVGNYLFFLAKELGMDMLNFIQSMTDKMCEVEQRPEFVKGTLK
jgi:NTP pyrophosphatase (non-canonical NTP hydrolase)